MAKGSVRKKGKKWYFRFYVEDESGNRIQKEMAGTESKAETESMLRKAMEEYENQKFVAKAQNVTLADMLECVCSCYTWSVSICGVSKTAYHIQSYAVCGS